MKIDIDHVAKLANIPLLSNEKKRFEKQLTAILDHFKKLSEVKTQITEETSQVTGLTNVTRSDDVRTSLSQDDALADAKETHNGMFVVPVILEEAIEE